MQRLELDDVQRMIKLVADASDPTISVPLPARKRALMQGTADLVDADVWIWSTAVLNPELERDVMSFGFVDGGWRSEEQRVAVFRELSNPKFNEAVTAPVVDCVSHQRYTTLLHHELIDPGYRPQFEKSWLSTGLESCVISVYPLNSNVYSAAGFHRSSGKPPLAERERMIVHAIFQQVDWLHREGTNVKAQDHVIQLSPRERHVLCFLLTGDSRKEIAAKLKLSEHTVGDYLKQIYKRFTVNSRSELLAQFIAGGRPN